MISDCCQFEWFSEFQSSVATWNLKIVSRTQQNYRELKIVFRHGSAELSRTEKRISDWWFQTIGKFGNLCEYFVNTVPLLLVKRSVFNWWFQIGYFEFFIWTVVKHLVKKKILKILTWGLCSLMKRPRWIRGFLLLPKLLFAELDITCKNLRNTLTLALILKTPNYDFRKQNHGRHQICHESQR